MAGCILDKTLWIVSGSSEAIPGIVRAKEMGLFVVVSDANPHAPGKSYADDFVAASTYGIEATVNAARLYHGTKRKIDGVISIAADVPLTVASVARALSLPGLSLESAFLASDKVAMKKRFKEAGIPIPWFQEIGSVGELQEVACKKGFPIVIKPVDSRGARGVLRLTEHIDLAWAFKHARSFSSSGRVMIEEYIDGPQISTESVMIDGKGYTPGFTDRNYEYLERFAPYIIENGGHQPSSLSKHERKQITECAEMAGLALGIHTGVAKGDMVMTSEGPKVIEMAARLSGGYFSTDQIPLATGVDLVGCAIKLALGETVEPCELVPVRQQGVAIRYFFPKPGRVVAVENMEKALKTQGVNKLKIFVSEGDVVEPVTNHTKRAGFVITQGESRQKAIELAQEMTAMVKIITEPMSSS
jgi:biotin carboxylase